MNKKRIFQVALSYQILIGLFGLIMQLDGFDRQLLSGNTSAIIFLTGFAIVLFSVLEDDSVTMHQFFSCYGIDIDKCRLIQVEEGMASVTDLVNLNYPKDCTLVKVGTADDSLWFKIVAKGQVSYIRIVK